MAGARHGVLLAAQEREREKDDENKGKVRKMCLTWQRQFFSRSCRLNGPPREPIGSRGEPAGKMAAISLQLPREISPRSPSSSRPFALFLLLRLRGEREREKGAESAREKERRRARSPPWFSPSPTHSPALPSSRLCTFAEYKGKEISRAPTSALLRRPHETLILINCLIFPRDVRAHYAGACLFRLAAAAGEKIAALPLLRESEGERERRFRYSVYERCEAAKTSQRGRGRSLRLARSPRVITVQCASIFCPANPF